MKTTTAELDPQAFAKVRELINDISIAMITTVTPDGTLRSRPMVTRQAGADGELWFFTASDSGKAHDIAQEHAVNVSYADPKAQRYVSVSGNATVVHDREKARGLWHPMLKTYFPKGMDDPQLALLRVWVDSAEYWDMPSNRMVQLYQIARTAVGRNRPGGPEHTKVDVRATPSSG
jgi:general stress protein 26